MRMVTCATCGEERPHVAKGLCNRCYQRSVLPRKLQLRKERRVPKQECRNGHTLSTHQSGVQWCPTCSTTFGKVGWKRRGFQ